MELTGPYYDSTFPTAKARAAFERSIFRQSQRTGGEIACLEGLTIVYRRSVDLFFYVVGGCQENELMLLAVLTCLLDALGHLLRKEVEKRWLLDNMEGTFLVVDEIVDRGVILESDPQQVIQRLSLRVSWPPRNTWSPLRMRRLRGLPVEGLVGTPTPRDAGGQDPQTFPHCDPSLEPTPQLGSPKWLLHFQKPLTRSRIHSCH
ncbi:coatomer subunit zeta-2 isoform X3 [Cuculus canorus]|uniref:coatomer subunit zeta-2 isoform X3 n=1 Tax=Cuculus canorus TaxID=55661 RepID=UPI0023AADFEE|nr:coatomer subunit zeta-2 isoform X3 [Cuculus canorus]